MLESKVTMCPTERISRPRQAAPRISGAETAEQAAVRFIDGIKSTRFLKPDGNPNPSWHMSRGTTWEAVDKLALHAAISTAKHNDRESKDHIPQPERINSLERAAHDEVLRATMWRDSYVCWRAAEDATLMVRAIFADDDSGSKGYLAIAESRWEVWKRDTGWPAMRTASSTSARRCSRPSGILRAVYSRALSAHKHLGHTHFLYLLRAPILIEWERSLR